MRLSLRHLLCPTGLTRADDAGVLVVPAVVGEPAIVRALPQLGFIPRALHVVQCDVAGASVEVALGWSRQGLATAELPAHHPGVHQVPAVIAHSAPRAAVEDLHPALTPVTAVPQPQGRAWGRDNRGS